MPLDDVLRVIVREEFDRVVGELTRPKPAKEWLSMSELARELGLSHPTIKAMAEAGCPHILPAGQPRFKLSEVVAWSRDRAVLIRPKCL